MGNIVGASFSHTHLRERGIPVETAWEAYSELGLPWVRLGCCWKEIEAEKGEYDFSLMERMLERCSRKNLKVVLTVGMKAPRWPEFYLPRWLRGEERRNRTFLEGDEVAEHLLAFVSRTVGKLKRFSCIRYWQMENEPLDQSGPLNMRIDSKLLEKEIARIRQEDPRPVVVNVWGNELARRGHYLEAARLADVVGFDLYARVPVASFGPWVLYRGPHDSRQAIREIIASLKGEGKQMWVSEFQTELWGKRESCTPRHIIENTQWVNSLGADGIFFWGFEYWLHEKLHGNTTYWDAARQAIGLLS